MIDFYRKGKPTPLDDLLRIYFLKNGSGGKGILKTVTGTLLHITDALAKPAKKFTATLEPIQDLHGQDAPYPSGGGKNKANPTTFSITRGTVFEFNPYLASGNYAYSYMATRTGSDSRNASMRVVYEDDSYLDLTIYVNSGNRKSGTITASKNIKSIYFYSISANWGDSGNFTLTCTDFQIESGSTATPFAPYENICPITGHTGASVVRTGKNLLVRPYHESRSTIANVEVTQNNDGSVTFNGTASGSMFFNFGSTNSNEVVFKTGTYTISGGDGKLQITAVKNGAYLTSTSKQTGYVTFTLEEESKIYFYASVSSGTVFDNDTYYPIVEVGSSPTSYSEYTATTIPITFPDAAGTVYGGTLTLEDGVWKLAVNRVSVNVVGKTSLACFTVEHDGIAPVYINPNNFTGSGANDYGFPDPKLNERTVICDYLKYGTNVKTELSANMTTFSNSFYRFEFSIPLNVSVGDTSATYKQNAIDYLNAHPLQLTYYIATPIEYTLTEPQALTLLKGTNNVWCDASDDLELQYYAKAEETP